MIGAVIKNMSREEAEQVLDNKIQNITKQQHEQNFATTLSEWENSDMGKAVVNASPQAQQEWREFVVAHRDSDYYASNPEKLFTQAFSLAMGDSVKEQIATDAAKAEQQRQQAGMDSASLGTIPTGEKA